MGLGLRRPFFLFFRAANASLRTVYACTRLLCFKELDAKSAERVDCIKALRAVFAL